MSKTQKKRTKKYHPKNPSIPWALMARMPMSEKHVASIRTEMTNSALRLRLNEKKDVNDASYLTAMFGIAWQLARQMTEKDAIKAQLANAAGLLVNVMESAEPMRAEIYTAVAEATDTAIEVFKASLGGEFEEARKNLLGKETVSFVERFFDRMDSIGLSSELIQSRTTADIPAPASSNP